MTKLFKNLLALGAISLIGFTPLAQAAAPKAITQVPGYYRIELGQFEVTALYDGAIELDTKLLINVSEVDLRRLLSRKFVGNPKMQTAVNAYLINTRNHLVLVDSGAGKLLGSTLGHVLQNMKAAGYEPEQVDTVILTHLHGDHIGGLNDADGQPLFPNARILVSRRESDFWLSQKTTDEDPSAAQTYFKMAHDCAAPYLANGQWNIFTEEGELVPGIRAVNAYGHTPGHTAFAVESEGEKLLIWGDLVHAHAVQFAKPGVSIEFDFDQKQAIQTRRSILKAVVMNKSLVAGAHLPFPGIGHVRAEGQSGFSWVPMEFVTLSPVGKQ